MFRPLALLSVAVLIGFAHQAVAVSNDTAASSDAAKIYTSFLNSWTGEEKGQVNVSIVAQAPAAEAIKEFSGCAGKTHWAPVEPVDDLTGLIGNLAYVRLVDPNKWSPHDPGNLIAKGQPVESAVASGIDNGLVTFSAITFDESHTKAAFTFSFVCGRLCGSGRTVVYQLTPTGWVESGKRCGSWISQIQRGRPNNSFKPMPLRGTA